MLGLRRLIALVITLQEQALKDACISCAKAFRRFLLIDCAAGLTI